VRDGPSIAVAPSGLLRRQAAQIGLPLPLEIGNGIVVLGDILGEFSDLARVLGDLFLLGGNGAAHRELKRAGFLRNQIDLDSELVDSLGRAFQSRFDPVQT